jgi:hypothetical protein
MLKLILLIMVFIGIIFIAINIVQDSFKCQEKQIIYRYIPRTFDEEQEDPAYVSDVLKSMWSHKSPWIYSVADIEINKQASMRDFIATRIGGEEGDEKEIENVLDARKKLLFDRSQSINPV